MFHFVTLSRTELHSCRATRRPGATACVLAQRASSRTGEALAQPVGRHVDRAASQRHSPGKMTTSLQELEAQLSAAVTGLFRDASPSTVTDPVRRLEWISAHLAGHPPAALEQRAPLDIAAFRKVAPELERALTDACNEASRAGAGGGDRGLSVVQRVGECLLRRASHADMWTQLRVLSPAPPAPQPPMQAGDAVALCGPMAAHGGGNLQVGPFVLRRMVLHASLPEIAFLSIRHRWRWRMARGE